MCLDVGASTGGFTDCLLQRGAARVHAIDVGYGQLDAKLRSDPRVVVKEKVNARSLSQADVPEEIALAAIDVSFISLRLILPAVAPFVAAGVPGVAGAGTAGAVAASGLISVGLGAVDAGSGIGFVTAAGRVTGSDGMIVLFSGPPASWSPTRTTSATIVSIARWSCTSTTCVVAGAVALRVVALGILRLNSSCS